MENLYQKLELPAVVIDRLENYHRVRTNELDENINLYGRGGFQDN